MKTIPFRKIATTFVTWLFACITLQATVLYYSAGFSAELAFRDAALSNVMIALSAYAMVNGLRFYQPRQVVIIVYCIVLTVICVLAIRYFSSYFVSSDPAYQLFFTKTILLRIIFAWLIIGLISLSLWLYSYFREQQELDFRRSSNEKLAREAELATLRQQLQPHFLFNSLNSISALVGSKPEEARKMIQHLSDFLRGTLKKDDQQLVYLSEELGHLQLYLDIEKVRFGHRMKTYVVHDDRSPSMKIPSLLLQPIVENAIKFGLYDTTGEIIIRLKSEAVDNNLIITVENPFDPQTSKPRQGTGFGLNSVQRRLYLLFARHDLLSTSQDDTTFTTIVKIPQLA